MMTVLTFAATFAVFLIVFASIVVKNWRTDTRFVRNFNISTLALGVGVFVMLFVK